MPPNVGIDATTYTPNALVVWFSSWNFLVNVVSTGREIRIRWLNNPGTTEKKQLIATGKPEAKLVSRPR